jgi:hypothetical protein
MTEDGIARYVTELSRVIGLKGTVLVSLLLINSQTQRAVEQETTLFSFVHTLGPNSWTIDPAQPLEAVGVSEPWIANVAQSRGFRIEAVEHGNWRDVRSWKVQHDWMCLRRTTHESAA